jgi:predicted aldo/keto reductase-like oxidoreductase
MIYREYGKTGKHVSAIGFGGMRFKNVDDYDTSAEMLLEAARGGINYFDTAPKYFGTKSEEIFGKAFKEFQRQGIQFYSSSKTFASTESSIRREIEGQLKRLNLDHIDFYHVWCITNLDNWRKRKQDGVIEAFRKLREEGLINHICVSSHLIGDHIKELLLEGVFEGVLFGYSAYNFQTRQAAFDAIKQYDMGCVVMNPLGGGLIPQNPDLFQFLKTREDEPVVEAALKFLLAHERIHVGLVGFGDKDEVRQALHFMDHYQPLSSQQLDEIKSRAEGSFEGICTGCQYCDDCPEGIPIPKLMDAYNHKLLRGEDQEILERLKMHWGISPDEAARCNECGQCEEECTQHLNIIERLKHIAGLKTAG